jgi:hypothetical protein
MTKLSQLTWDGENISFAITSPAYKGKRLNAPKLFHKKVAPNLPG